MRLLAPNIATQIRGRLRESTVHLLGAGDLAGCVLRAFECLYTHGPASYFGAVVGALNSLAERISTFFAPMQCGPAGTAHALAGQNADLDAAIAAYADRVVARRSSPHDGS